MNPHRAHKPVDEFDETPIKYPSKLPAKSDGKNPHVMIVGAGVGGLFLAILLDKAGIPYEIYERTSEVKALGSAMSLNANILAAFEQLGLYEEFKKIALPCQKMEIMYEDMKTIATIDISDNGLTGYEHMLFSRPKLYALLESKVPKERIHFNKKVLSMMQNKEGVMIRCADGTTYHGDVLVGADGAYSAVRQGLYKSLQDKNLLPEVDAKDLNKGYACLVGTTDPVDPEKYPFVKSELATRLLTIGEGTPYTWVVYNVAENKICYMIVCQYKTLALAEQEKFRNSEWAPERNADMIKAVKDFPAPCGGTMGDLINLTPADRVSRVYLEDKIFSTWTHGRTVLIGDAAHKLLPSAGQGAITAMQDAIILANCLYDLESLAQQDIQAALEDFREQRHDKVEEIYQKSKTTAALSYGQTWIEKIMRYLVFNCLPHSAYTKNLRKETAYRPQATFLPLAEVRGTGPVLPQKPSKRYEAELKKKAEEESETSSAAITAVAAAAAV
ncbi:hypothetical protein EMPS_03678 [Entomortierella parvispora]|uniref:FAD-binding domain-containing protein n=1 Tax=Entomortierella parvispora TaxID=205924 RepID=A0A9P3H787_9FUNG|nr:hypothetical protein EMPS_03678 [Entomortierella parvispora]